MRSKLAPAQPYQVTDPLMRIDGEIDGNDAVDNSGNGLDMEISQGVMIFEDSPSGGRSFRAWGGTNNEAYLTVNDASLDNISAKTFAFWVKKITDGEAGARIFDKSNNVFCVTSAADLVFFYERWTVSGLSSWRTAESVLLGGWSHVVIRHDGIAGSVPEISIDGVGATMVTLTASAGVKSDDTGAFYLFDRSALNAEFDGFFSEFQWFDRYLTDQEARDLYLRSATRVKRIAHRTEYPVTGTLTSGFVGPFEIVSGSFQWQAGQRLYSVLSGHAGLRSTQTYGAWYFRLFKLAGGTVINTNLTSSLNNVLTTSGNDGYCFRVRNDGELRLTEFTSGVVTDIYSGEHNISEDTEYEIFITRDSANEFSIYIKGGVWTDWTLLKQVTDSTHTTSSWFGSRPSTGCYVEKITFFPYGMTLDPTTDDLSFLDAA